MVSETAGGLTRRQWVTAVPCAVALAVVAPASALGEQKTASKQGGVHGEFPSHDPTTVGEVVAASHANIDRVAELVEASPALAKATWDWGFGDWESALGAASHMGRRDIAELLMSHGARPNLFTFTMLGHLEVVKAHIAARPGIQRIAGPHGITLLAHALNGGKQAQAVADFLRSVGDADIGPKSLALTDEQKQLYLGRYAFGRGDDQAFEVLVNRRGMLAIQRGTRFSRVLNRVAEHVFAPSGAPAVRVGFKFEKGRAVSLTVHDPVPLVTARFSG